jgi:hypothetical protein
MITHKESKKIRQEHIAKLATQAYYFPRIYRLTFEGDEFNDRHDRFVKKVADIAYSMMNLLRQYSEIIDPDFVKGLEGVDHHELEKI